MSTAPRCPRFDSCNANICPLDPRWPLAQHIQGERVCSLLTELVKVGGQTRVEGIVQPDQFATLVREWPKVEARWTDIRSRLKASAKTGSRIDIARARFHPQLQGTEALPIPEAFPHPSMPSNDLSAGASSEVPA
jgi:hypothetical protein